MADWRDVMTARADADAAAELAETAAPLPGLEPLVDAVLAVRLELRALGMIVDYAKGGPA